MHVECAGVGPWDTEEREGMFASIMPSPPRFPYVCGSEARGPSSRSSGGEHVVAAPVDGEIRSEALGELDPVRPRRDGEHAGAPDVPPDAQFRTGVESGEDVYVWECYKGNRTIVRQYGSACTGTRPPILDKGPCGAALPVEANYPPLDSGLASTLETDYRWPGSPPPTVATATHASSAPATAAPSASSAPSAPSASSAASDVMSRVLAANAALDASYKTAPPHPGPWVSEGDANVAKKPDGSMTITWMYAPPSGFEWSACRHAAT